MKYSASSSAMAPPRECPTWISPALKFEGLRKKVGDTYDRDTVSPLGRKETLNLSEDLRGSQGVGIAETIVHKDAGGDAREEFRVEGVRKNVHVRQN